MDTAKIQQLSIPSLLYALHIPNVADLPSDQARQFFQRLLTRSHVIALRAHVFFKTLDFGDEHALPGLCRFPPFQTLISTAVTIPIEKLTFSLTLECLYKLSEALWRGELPALLYPTAILDRTARQCFKDEFISALTNSETSRNSAYPLDQDSLALIANIIDIYQLRAFQKLELNALTLHRHDPLDILKRQPRLSHNLQREITTFISKSFSATTHSTFYAAIVHGYVDVPSKDRKPPATDRLIIYTKPIASLVADYLRTGVRPHQQTDTRWTSLHISVYEDTSITREDRPALVTAQDLLKQSPINHSQFNLHPFISVDIGTLDDFLDRLDRLPMLYQQDVINYWAPVTSEKGAKTIWRNHLKHAIETTARIGLADSTLTHDSHTQINQILSQSSAQALPPAISTYTCAFVDLFSGKAFPISGTFLIEQQASASKQNRLVAFALNTGAVEYESWEAFEKRLLSQMADSNSRPLLLDHLSKKSALNIVDFCSTQPARLGLKKMLTAAYVVDELVEGLLVQQAENFLHDFTAIKNDTLPAGLEAFCNALNPSLAQHLTKQHARWINHRQTSMLEQLPGKTLSDALVLTSTARAQDIYSKDLDSPILDLSALNKLAFNDTKCRALMIGTLNTDKVGNTLKGVMSHVVSYFSAETPVPLSLRFLALQRICAYRDERQIFSWQHPGSLRHNFYYFMQLYASNAPSDRLGLRLESVGLRLLGMKQLPSEGVHPYYSARELTLAQDQSPALVSILCSEIKATPDQIDLTALASYLNLSLLADYDPEHMISPAQPRNYSLYHELLLDLPGLHRLGKALGKIIAPGRNDAQTSFRALAISVITDYLYPPTEQKPGYICGLNLHSVELGESPVSQVRETLRAHLKQRLPKNVDRQTQRFVFTLLCARYAPELLVTQVPATLLYGQTLDSLHWRHAVACLEAEQPCSSQGLSYVEIVTAYSNAHYAGLSDDKKTAVALLKQLPSLHFAMCQGVIPETEIAWVTHADSLKAVAYVSEQEALEAQTFTHLAQVPPQRKNMASSAFKKANPGVDAEQIIAFTEAELKKYFHVHPSVAADRHIGRRMRMTLLEKYMSCVSGVGFTEQEIGVKPYPHGACELQARFDQQFSIYKDNFLSAMVDRLALALHGTPQLDRERILNAYKYIKVSFENSQGNWEESRFGLIALYKENEDIQYAYEIFCPSGTVRALPLSAKRATRIHVTSSPPTQDALWHELPYLYISPLNEGAYLRGAPDQKESTPYLMVSFYTVRRQTQGMSRAQKIQYLCKKMVNAVFGNIMDLAYPYLKSPTPYETHKERLFARAQLMARFVLPGYALYQDIKAGKVTLGTIITTALEMFSLLLPFVGLGIKALSISTRLGRVIILSKSTNFSKVALTAAKAIQPLQSSLPNVLLRSLGAANPFGAIALLFQYSHKGMLAIKFLLRFTRAEMSQGPTLFKTLAHRHLPALEYRPLSAVPTAQGRAQFFKPDTRTGDNKLNIQQQFKLHARAVDVSEITAVNSMYVKEGKTYIYLQGNIFAVRKLHGTDAYQLYNDTHIGPRVKFDHTRNRWEIQC